MSRGRVTQTNLFSNVRGFGSLMLNDSGSSMDDLPDLMVPGWVSMISTGGGGTDPNGWISARVLRSYGVGVWYDWVTRSLPASAPAAPSAQRSASGLAALVGWGRPQPIRTAAPGEAAVPHGSRTFVVDEAFGGAPVCGAVTACAGGGGGGGFGMAATPATPTGGT